MYYNFLAGSDIVSDQGIKRPDIVIIHEISNTTNRNIRVYKGDYDKMALHEHIITTVSQLSILKLIVNNY